MSEPRRSIQPGRTRGRGPTRLAPLAALALLGAVLATAGAAVAQPDRRGPSPERLHDRVEDRLARSPSLAGTRIEVEVKGRTVTLSGPVGSEGERERAVRLAEGVRGVSQVEDELRIDAEGVAERRAERVGDEELARSIAEALAAETFPEAQVDQEWLFGWEVEGEDWEFDVDVDDGNVTLEGSVDDFDDISRVTRAVRNMPGVRSVSSGLWVSYADAPPYPYYYGPHPPWDWRYSDRRFPAR